MSADSMKNRREFLALGAIGAIGAAALPGCRIDGVADTQQTAGAATGRVLIQGAGGRPRMRKRWGSLTAQEKALEAFAGTREMSGKPMLEYFAPLQAWLAEQNRGKQCGW